MRKRAKYYLLQFDLSKALDHPKGIEDEYTICAIIRGQGFYDTGSCRLPEDLKVEDLLPGVTKTDSSLEGREEREDSGV
jgi:hypothetical protein